MSVSTEQPWTIGRLLDWTAKFLAQKGSESPRLDTEVLLAHALGCERIQLYTRYDEEASEEARQKFRELIRKRVEGCPVAYLVGRKEFFSLRFEVGPAVLIPRPDTECVVVECLRLAKGLPEPAALDIGTGSGAIAVAVARQHKGAKVTATDLSAEALAVARRNAERHGVAGRVRFLQGDLFGPVPPGKQFDLILSNPPYIATEDLPKLPVGVRDYEPRLALDGGPGGYAVFDRLIDQARDRLKPGGYLIVEIGSPQEAEARKRIGAYGEYELGPTVKDGSGHPRVLLARRRAGG
ncbi:MAG TPA: peptide chain release factor N(5)-glutamine methyltransferase [Gemmataceae bacterium]|nr:peptide chain release factor N(5)-glutamine methyltransferase [Gemmataceae bacterium]